MRFNFALVSSFLLASVVLADRRHEHRRRLSPVERSDDVASNGVHHATETAGAEITADELFTYATGKFTVPRVHGSNGSGAFVTLGADYGSDSGFTLAVRFAVENGHPVYEAFGAFNGGQSQTFSDVSIATGNDLQLTLWVSSPTSGHAEIKNISTGKSSKKYFETTRALRKGNVAWGMGVPADVTLLDFGTVKFWDAKASGADGEHTPSDESTIINIPGQISTSVDGSTVTFKYQ